MFLYFIYNYNLSIKYQILLLMEGTLDFSKIRCKEHPLQLVANFCINNSCMVGLCSQCVCVHTQMHTRSGTAPILKPLKEIHTKYHTQINNLINLLETDKDKIMNLMKSMLDRKKNYKLMMEEVKKDALKVLDKIFIQFQIKFQEQVKNEQKRTGLHSSFQIETLCKKINREISTLVNQAQLLNSNKFLDMVKTIKMNTFDEIQKMRRQFAREIKDNQEFVTKLIYNRQYIHDIEIATRKLISHSFCYPKVITNYVKQPPVFTRSGQGFHSFNKQNNSSLLTNNSEVFTTYLPVGPNSSVISSNHELRNSVLLNQSLVPIKFASSDKKSSNGLQRSNSVSGVNYVPHQDWQYNNYPVQLQLRNCPSQFRMTGSRIINNRR